MKYGQDLIKDLEKDIETIKAIQSDRAQRIAAGETDVDDCFISMRHDEQSVSVCREKIRLLEKGGCEWFVEYATLDGTLVDAKWCNTRFGGKLRVKRPNGEVIWTTASTAKGLAKVGLKRVECLRPAWFAFKGSSFQIFPSDTNYATGETASAEPIEIRACEA